MTDPSELFPAVPRCPRHDVIVDRDTGCDLCRDCRDCGGYGYTEQRHPDWGRLSCTAPTVETTCATCGGTGKDPA